MRKYNLYVLGVSESRWVNLGRMWIIIGEILLYFGWEDGYYYEGVVVIFKKGVEKFLMEWKLVSSRLMLVRFRGK